MTVRRLHPRWTRLWYAATGVGLMAYFTPVFLSATPWIELRWPWNLIAGFLGAVGILTALLTKPLDMKADGAPPEPPRRSPREEAEAILTRMAGNGPLPAANAEHASERWVCTSCGSRAPSKEALSHPDDCPWMGARTIRWLYGGRLP